MQCRAETELRVAECEHNDIAHPQRFRSANGRHLRGKRPSCAHKRIQHLLAWRFAILSAWVEGVRGTLHANSTRRDTGCGRGLLTPYESKFIRAHIASPTDCALGSQGNQSCRCRHVRQDNTGRSRRFEMHGHSRPIN